MAKKINNADGHTRDVSDFSEFTCLLVRDPRRGKRERERGREREEGE